MKIELQKAAERDMEYLLQLRKDTMTDHLENMGIQMSDSTHRTSILRDFDNASIIYVDGRRAGLLKFIVKKDLIDIKQFQIQPDEQGKGIGNFILEWLITKGKEGKRNLRLKVLKNNPAKRLYERLGFEIYDEDKYEYFMKLNEP